MVKLTFSSISLVSVCLLVVSAFSLSFMPSSDDNDSNAAFASGQIIFSESEDGTFTAIPGVGNGSYTVTATPTVAGSETDAATDTSLVGNDTGSDTTIG